MRAAILVAQHEPLVVDEVELPSELSYGQVLVRVAYSGICGSQLGEIDGAKGPDSWLPHLLGHEGAGTVLETGPGVKTVAAGDHAVLHWQQGDGIAADPPAYTWRGERLNAGWVTTFNEYAIVSENRVTAIPAGLDLATATLFGCAITTGLGVVANDAAVKLGESVVVFGAGGVGLSIVQGAALAGAQPIVAVDLHGPKLELAQRLGATHAIDSSQTGARAAVAEIVGADGADVVVDNTGNTGVIELAYELTAPAGRTILVGVPPAGNDATIYTLPLHFGKVLRGSHGGGAYPPADIPRYLKLVAAGKLDLDALVTDSYELDQINEAIADLRAGKIAGRCVLAVAPEDGA